MDCLDNGSIWLPPETPLKGVLRCLDAAFFIASFEEEGYLSIGDLREDGEETVMEFVKCLSMPPAAHQQFYSFVFENGGGAGEKRCVDETSAPEKPKMQSAGVAQCSRALDDAWLQTISPLYSQHMGCENMGPLLYSLVRFVKPTCCLEIGAGYTSAFLLQALEDNATEAGLWNRWLEQPDAANKSWLVAGSPALSSTSQAVLHCVDNFAHPESTAPPVLRVAKELGLDSRLRIHLDNAQPYINELSPDSKPFDFVWLDGLLDFAPPLRSENGAVDVGAGIDAFLTQLWPRVAPGGFVLLHSTLTNSAVRKWLEGIDGAPWGPPGAMISLMEPHKRFQNSCTLLQRRPASYSEPIHSKLP